MNMQVPAHIANRQRRGLAETARTGLGRGVPSISIEGQAFTLVDENGQTRPVPTPYLDCVIIDVTNVVGRVFWGMETDYGGYTKNYQKGTAVPPVCFSDNGIGASSQAQDPQSTNCKGCRWSEWGSAKSRMTGQGIPACGSTKKIAVYVPGVNFPFLLRIPVMSHDNFKNFLSLFIGQDFDADQVWTRISFVHGAQGVLQFEPTSKYDPNHLWVDDASLEVIDGILEHRMTDQLVGRGDVPWQGPVAQVAGPAGGTAQLQPPPGAPPNPATSGNMTGGAGTSVSSAAPPANPLGFGQGPAQGGFGGVQGQGQAPAQTTQPAQPARRGRGRPKATEQPQNPAQPGTTAAPSGFTAPPAAPATAAPFGGGAIASGAAPSNELGAALGNAFGLPVGGR